MDKYYEAEAKDSMERGACDTHINRMIFLSKGTNIDSKINRWVNQVDDHWFDKRGDRKIILHKAIQHGVQIALDINKALSAKGSK